MRGVRLSVCASTLLWAACTAPPPSAEADPLRAKADRIPAPIVVEDFHPVPSEPPVVQDPPPGGGAKVPATPIAGVVPTSVEVPPRREATFDEVIRLQKEVVARNPASDEDKLRLALLQATAGNFEEAERVLSTARSRASRFQPYFELFLRRQLGDHKEAARLLAQLDEEDRRATGFVVERAELVARVRRFRDYAPAESDRVPPGGDVHLYVEPRNFALQRSGDKHTFHLRYEWKLYDDRSAEQPVTAWEKATADEREDRITSNGPVAEFYQSFHLPLPANLAAGRYRVRVTVTDVLSGKSDRAYVPITVTPLEKNR